MKREKALEMSPKEQEKEGLSERGRWRSKMGPYSQGGGILGIQVWEVVHGAIGGVGKTTRCST